MRKPKGMPKEAVQSLMEDAKLTRQQAYKAWLIVVEELHMLGELRANIPAVKKPHSLSTSTMIKDQISKLKSSDLSVIPKSDTSAEIKGLFPKKEDEPKELDIPDRRGEW